MSEPRATMSSDWNPQSPQQPNPAAVPWWAIERTSEVQQPSYEPEPRIPGPRHSQQPGHGHGAYEPPAPPAPPAVDITPTYRGAIVARLRRFSFLHARHAWERRRRDPLAPHGMALFYCEPSGQLYDQLRTATRIFLADEEAASLPHLLYGLAQHAREGFAADPRFDPRTAMCNKTDDMSSQAVFAGIGVVTLDTPHGDWPTAQRTARSEADLPGRCYARLIDGTMLVLDRGGELQFNAMTVECSVRDGNLQYGTPSMHWRWNPAIAETPESDPMYHVWRWMGEIGRIIDHGSRPR
ncbi:hypothetical protein Dvina_41300 [Dactylosporangium vinaceum]|uniref:Uncharacterized protein n=1 Tax=Dactylosporangium vinaceum TaxID=53362 RepID=A0ABV5MP50_9ACTN|nr:hypothetical protein [Dactylosporangium vinaceum]UAB94517.1 hypothetical protein Dvina_41300 [Dactylosporangium vinaceum]